MGILSTIGDVADAPGSIIRALLAGELGRGASGIFNPQQRVSGRELVKKYTGEDNGLLGTLAEFATDPLLLAGGIGMLGKGVGIGGKVAEGLGTAGKAAEGLGMASKAAELSSSLSNPLSRGYASGINTLGGKAADMIPSFIKDAPIVEKATGVLDRGANAIANKIGVVNPADVLDVGGEAFEHVPPTTARQLASKGVTALGENPLVGRGIETAFGTKENPLEPPAPLKNSDGSIESEMAIFVDSLGSHFGVPPDKAKKLFITQIMPGMVKSQAPRTL